MDLTIEIQKGTNCLLCTISGKWINDELIGFINTVSIEIKRQGCRRILADLSMVAGPPTDIERYDIGKYFASAIPGVKTAVVYQKVYKNNFFEDTAVNRGALIKIFPARESALQWLMKDNTPRTDAGDIHH